MSPDGVRAVSVGGGEGGVTVSVLVQAQAGTQACAGAQRRRRESRNTLRTVAAQGRTGARRPRIYSPQIGGHGVGGQRHVESVPAERCAEEGSAYVI